MNTKQERERKQEHKRVKDTFCNEPAAYIVSVQLVNLVNTYGIAAVKETIEIMGLNKQIKTNKRKAG